MIPVEDHENRAKGATVDHDQDMAWSDGWPGDREIVSLGFSVNPGKLWSACEDPCARASVWLRVRRRCHYSCESGSCSEQGWA